MSASTFKIFKQCQHCENMFEEHTADKLEATYDGKSNSRNNNIEELCK